MGNRPEVTSGRSTRPTVGEERSGNPEHLCSSARSGGRALNDCVMVCRMASTYLVWSPQSLFVFRCVSQRKPRPEILSFLTTFMALHLLPL